MTTLIFEPTLSGHHLEYLHHLYERSVEMKDESFVFAVPRDEWGRMQEKQKWSDSPNTKWLLLDDDECRRVDKGNQFVRCWRLSRLIRRTAKSVGANCILLISLAGAIPFLPLVLPVRVKLSGIIYKIHLRAPHDSFVKRFIDQIRYFIMAHSRSVDKVFILNDPRSASQLNKTYHTDRFISLADPVPEIESEDIRDMCSELHIADNDCVYLHFGAMDERKGTLDILNAIVLIPSEELIGKVFIFAGRVSPNISKEFYSLVSKCQEHGAQLIVRDEFVDYSTLHSLCKTCDCILIPYKFTDLSSGALGYAALHGKPVIGPSTGLIGDLIRDNHLGMCLKEVTPSEIAKAISDTTTNLIMDRNCAMNYCNVNSRQNFSKTLI